MNDPDNKFAIDANGQITLISALNFESNESHTFQLTASLNGENETFDFIVNVQNQISIQILDCTDAGADCTNPDDITDSDATIFVSEFAELGTLIATVNANDPNATFALVDPDNKFAIDANGQITFCLLYTSPSPRDY